MKKSIIIKSSSNINEQTARELFKKANVEHVYGIATSVCSLLRENFLPSGSKEIGIITIQDLNLDENSTYTFQDVAEACLKNGYSKITVPEIFSYLNDSVHYGSIVFHGPAVALMDTVIDGEGEGGIIFLNSEENFLRRISFFSPDNSKKLSEKAQFLVVKT